MWKLYSAKWLSYDAKTYNIPEIYEKNRQNLLQLMKRYNKAKMDGYSDQQRKMEKKKCILMKA